MSGWVYIMTNQRGGTLYVGVTNDLVRRVFEHREGTVSGFTKTHGLKRLVWFEEHATIPLAIQREKTLKRWLRAWKLALIEENNPEWEDLWARISS
jgi:putative endonuclease